MYRADNPFPAKNDAFNRNIAINPQGAGFSRPPNKIVFYGDLSGGANIERTV